MSVDDLPDIAAIKQIAEALWRRRATVFVGAGFSLNARKSSPTTPRPPLWPDLAKAMTAKLYGADAKLAPSDPLKLAEEFRALYGQAALDDFVRQQIPDAAWAPAPIHVSLLELPWSDVLTTNYDTLLERASRDVDNRRYEPVLMEGTLAHALAPRIVKLHGSLEASEHFILAEEDYRTYPAKHAAFVNFARQSFIENELCLLGFSGDDPNFLQWSGWVRDHLGSSTRRIYLVGLLELSAAKRKYLEARNIAPIDLAPLVKDLESHEQHGAALGQFIDYLRQAEPAKPWDWEPVEIELSQNADDYQRSFKDPDFAAELYRKNLEAWRIDRTTYPGWLVCPRKHWGTIGNAFDGPPPRPTTLTGLTDAERAEVIFLHIFRQHLALRRIDQADFGMAAEIADPAASRLLAKTDQIALALILAGYVRRADDDDAFERMVSLVEAHAAEGSDARAGAAYERALRARDRRDLSALEALAPLVDGPDPIWGVRRAALLLDLGEDEAAAASVAAAVCELRRRQRLEVGSLWVMSRRAWALLLARALERNRWSESARWSEEFRVPYCDPWVHLDALSDDLRDVRDKHLDDETIKPDFTPGRFTDPAKTVHLSGDPDSHIEWFRRLVEDVGIPFQLQFVSILGVSIRNLVLTSRQMSVWDVLRVVAMLRQQNDPVVRQIFARPAVAAMSAADRALLIGVLRREIDYWRGATVRTRTKGSQIRDRLGLLIELLSRVVLCADSALAEDTFRFALELGQDLAIRNAGLFEPISNLAQWSVEAVPPAQRGVLAAAALAFPTPAEAGFPTAHDFPAASGWLWPIAAVAKRPPDVWDERVDRLLSALAQSPQATEARLRLTALARFNLLSPEEAAAFGKTLWSTLDKGEPAMPVSEPIVLGALRWLPHPEGIDVMSLLSRRLFDTPAALNLMELRGFRALEDTEVRPTSDQSAAMFDHLVAWRPKVHDHPVSQLLSGLDSRPWADAIAQALSRVVIPALGPGGLTEARLDAAFAFEAEVKDPDILQGIVVFADALPDRREQIAAKVRRALFGGDYEAVQAAAEAVFVWRKRSSQSFSPAMIDHLLAAFEGRRPVGLYAVIVSLYRLVRLRALGPAQLARLEAPLGDYVEETAYDRIRPDTLQAVSVSLVRKGCVRLARALKAVDMASAAADAWLAAAREDPLPEVRFTGDDAENLT